MYYNPLGFTGMFSQALSGCEKQKLQSIAAQPTGGMWLHPLCMYWVYMVLVGVMEHVQLDCVVRLTQLWEDNCFRGKAGLWNEVSLTCLCSF